MPVTLLKICAVIKPSRSASDSDRLKPNEIYLERFAPKPSHLRLPRQSVLNVQDWVTEAVFYETFRPGISLEVEFQSPGQSPGKNKLIVEIARGLGKRDRHWLITRLLQHCHQSRNEAENDSINNF